MQKEGIWRFDPTGGAGSYGPRLRWRARVRDAFGDSLPELALVTAVTAAVVSVLIG